METKTIIPPKKRSTSMSQSSRKFSIVIFGIALLFLSYSVYIFYKTDSLQNNKVEDLTSGADEASRRISDLSSNLEKYYIELDNLLKIKEDLENLSTDLDEIKELVTENVEEIDALTTDFEIINESLTELSEELTQVDEIARAGHSHQCL